MRFIDLPNPTIYRRQARYEALGLPSFLISMLDDILHVRLQTLGVTEHSFDINVAGTHYTWLLYDVGGAVSFYHPCLYPFLVDWFLEIEGPGKQLTFCDKTPRHLRPCHCSGMHGCLTLKMVRITGPFHIANTLLLSGSVSCARHRDRFKPSL
jgi:hypothetical protein